jgi:holo-[acyl-carrier protein] synthase
VILGIGLDWVENGRIARAIELFGERFAHRILLQAEWDYCRSLKEPVRHVAARFAAKEAASKAFGVGIGIHLGWHDVEIVRSPGGPPMIALHGKGHELFWQRGARRIHVSLTHTEGHSAAVVILEN